MTINREDEWKIEGLEVSAPLDSDQYLSLEPLVNDVASREWGGTHVCELDDVVQAIWLHITEHWDEYESAGEGLIRNMARRAARTYCKQQRIDYMYANGAFLYTPAMVRRFMEEAVFCAPENAIDLDARADISEAMKHLPRGQRAAIFKRYALKEPLLTPGEKSAESRGVAAITDRLNTGLRLQPVIFP